MAFRIGQKVVFVGEYKWGWPGITLPTKGGVYTIRNFEDRGPEPALRLYEIVHPPMHHSNVFGLIEPAFPTAYFRPLVERKTDISIFTKMLRDTKAPANA